MNPKQITKEINKLTDQINLRYKKIQELQNSCPHEDVQGEYKANTGNWCKDDDSYWIEAKCWDCGKRWNIDSKDQPDLYRSFKFKRIV
jgi:hypothetical protein